MWHVIQTKTWLLSLQRHPLLCVYSEWFRASERARVRTHARSTKSSYFTCGSHSFVLSNLFLWHNQSANFIQYHSISINSRSKLSSMNCVAFLHIADGFYFQWEFYKQKPIFFVLFFPSLCLNTQTVCLEWNANRLCESVCTIQAFKIPWHKCGAKRNGPAKKWSKVSAIHMIGCGCLFSV